MCPSVSRDGPLSCDATATVPVTTKRRATTTKTKKTKKTADKSRPVTEVPVLLRDSIGDLWNDRYARMLQEILDSGIEPHGAYCLGIVTVLSVNKLERLPSRSVLLRAAKCARIPEAIAIGEKYIERVRKTLRR